MSDASVIDTPTLIEVMIYRLTKGAAKVEVRKASNTRDSWFVTAPCVLEKGEYLRTVDSREAALDFATNLVHQLAAMHALRSTILVEEAELRRSLREATVSDSPLPVT